MTQRNNTRQRPNNQDAQANQNQSNNLAQANQDQPNHQMKEETIFDNNINTFKPKTQETADVQISLFNEISHAITRIDGKIDNMQRDITEMNDNIRAILDQLTDYEPEWSKSAVYIRDNLNDLKWSQTMEFFTELINRINENNEINPIPEFSRNEKRKRKYLFHKLDQFWTQISRKLEDPETVQEIKNLILNTKPT